MPRYTVVRVEEVERYAMRVGYGVRRRRLNELFSKVEELLNNTLEPYGGIAFNTGVEGEYIALTNGVDREQHLDLLFKLDWETPHGVRVASLKASNPVVALLSSSSYFRRGERFLFEEDDGGVGEEYWVAMIALPRLRGYEAHVAANTLGYSISRAMERYGGLVVEKTSGAVTIIGGGGLEALAGELREIGPVGIGVSQRGLNAYRNAVKALQRLLDGIAEERVCVLRD